MLSYKNKQPIRKLPYVFFAIYMIVLMYFLLFSEGFGRTDPNAEYRYNLVLFHEIKRFIMYYNIVGMKNMVINVIGNIVAFVPFGFFMAFLGNKRRGAIHVVLLSLELSLGVEVIQLLTKVGSYDVDDILLNTIGGAIGYIFYLLCCQIMKRRSDRGIS